MVPRDLLLKSIKNQRKLSQSDPSTSFRALSLRKEICDFGEVSSSFSEAGTRPPSPAWEVCVLRISVTEADLHRECTDLSQNAKKSSKTSRISVRVKGNRREGSRRLTVVQGVSQMDSKSDFHPFHTYKGFSAQT